MKQKHLIKKKKKKLLSVRGCIMSLSLCVDVFFGVRMCVDGVDVCGCVWMCVDVCGCVWMCVDVCGCVWMCVDVDVVDTCGCVWMCVSVCWH
jgi:hypothetical protein